MSRLTQAPTIRVGILIKDSSPSLDAVLSNLASAVTTFFVVSVPFLAVWHSTLSTSLLSDVFEVIKTTSAAADLVSSTSVLLSLTEQSFRSGDSPAVSVPMGPSPRAAGIGVTLHFSASYSQSTFIAISSV